MRSNTFLRLISAVTGLANAGVAHADSTDDYVRAEMTKRQIPGISIAVMRDGKVVKEAVYGLASVELNVPATPQTSYVLASMTKIFTASAIMLLVQERKTALDDSITKILPQLPAAWSAVTVRDCLAHTSGLPDDIVASDQINVLPLVAGGRNDMLEELARMPVKSPGENVSYNQTEYVLLGMIIEKLSGLRYEQFVERRILEPAGLARMRFGDAWAVIPGRAPLYTAIDTTTDHSKLLVRDGRPISSTSGILHYGSKAWPDYDNPAAGLNGSIRDLEKWEATLADHALLTAASQEEMTKPFKLKNGKNGDFGLGFLIYHVGRYRAVAFGGGNATWRLAIPERHLTIIVLTNLQESESSPATLAAGIAALYVPDLAPSSGR